MKYFLLLLLSLNTFAQYNNVSPSGDVAISDVSGLQAALDLKAALLDISAVGLSNDYADLDNKPTLLSQFTNDLTGINADKIADGSVSSTEFQYINTLSSNAQTQINSKLASADYGKCSGAGVNNTCTGTSAGINNTSNYNTFYGFQAGMANTTGNLNSFFGERAGTAITTGTYLTCLGELACGNVTSPDFAVHIGVGAGYNNQNNYSISIGRWAGFSGNSVDAYNVFIGEQSGYSNTSGIYGTFAGAYAGFSNTTGQGNSFYGEQAGQTNTTGQYNTAIGYGALYSATTANDNVMVGEYAGGDLSTGTRNTMVGTEAGYTETPANTSVTSSDVTFIGWKSGAGTTTQITNAVAVGSGATINASNSWIIGKLGHKQRIVEGSNAAMGVATLVGGTVTVTNNLVTANSRIFYSRQAAGGTLGNLSIARSAGVSFTINSDNGSDTSTVAWEIKEPQ